MDKQQSRRASADSLARGLGLVGVALGVARLLMPRSGAPAPVDKDGAGPPLPNGVLELACGIGILGAMKALDLVARKTAAPPCPGIDFPDYSDRVGMARTPAEMRGEARKDFEAPRDMRTPEALRPWTTQPDA